MTGNADRPVREVLKEVYAAWEANDADAFAKPYAEAATASCPAFTCPAGNRSATRWRRCSPVS